MKTMFNQSRNTGKVSDALAKVQAEMPVFTVDKEGYQFRYLTLAKIFEILLPIAGKHNLSIAQFPSVEVIDDQPWVNIMTRISCEDEYFDSNFSFLMILPSKKNDTDIMSMASTVSYLKRFAIQSIFGISGADEMDPEQRQKEDMDENESLKLK